MKEFLKRQKKNIKAFAAVILTSVLLIELVNAANYLTVDNVDSYTRVALHEFYHNDEKKETFFIGTSHCFRAYASPLYEKMTGEKTFNLGTSSQNLDTTYYLLKEAVRVHPVKKVYLDMHYAFMFLGGEGQERDMVQLNIVTDYTRPSVDKLMLMAEASGFEQFTNSLLPFRREWSNLGDFEYISELMEKKSEESYKTYQPVINKDEYYDKDGFVWSDKQVVTKNFKWWDNYDKIDVSGDDTFGRKYVDKIVSLCKKKGIELIFVTAPSNEEFLKHVGPYDPAHAYIQSIADEYGVPYLDFNYCKKDVLELKDECFMDMDHLNGKGAFKVTMVLSEIVNQPALIDEYFASCYDNR